MNPYFFKVFLKDYDIYEIIGNLNIDGIFDDVQELLIFFGFEKVLWLYLKQSYLLKLHTEGF